MVRTTIRTGIVDPDLKRNAAIHSLIPVLPAQYLIPESESVSYLRHYCSFKYLTSLQDVQFNGNHHEPYAGSSLPSTNCSGTIGRHPCCVPLIALCRNQRSWYRAACPPLPGSKALVPAALCCLAAVLRLLLGRTCHVEVSMEYSFTIYLVPSLFSAPRPMPSREKC